MQVLSLWTNWRHPAYWRVALMAAALYLLGAVSLSHAQTLGNARWQFTPQQDRNRLSTYYDNLALPYYYTTDPDQTYFAPQNPNGGNISRTNVHFQISLKYGLAAQLFHDNDGIYLSYSQVSNWQAYDESAYFRDSQYQPELFYVQVRPQQQGWHWQQFQTGFMHQSNGKGGTDERSWNRLYIEGQWGNKQWAVNVRPWARIRFSGTNYNPNITDYMGYGDVKLRWQGHKQRLALTLRNQIESGFSKGYQALSYEFPLYGTLHGYLLLQSGYGLTVSTYNAYDNAIGIGIVLR